MHLVVVPRLVLKQDRQFRDIDVAILDIVLAGDGPQVQHLQVLGQCELELVEVRKLIPVRVNGPVVRVPLQRPGRRGDGIRRLPGGEHGQVRVQRPVAS